MISPNKFIPFDQSILRRLEIILDRDRSDVGITQLFKETSAKFDDVNQFMYTIDVLFVLGCIEIDFKERTLKYVN